MDNRHSQDSQNTGRIRISRWFLFTRLAAAFLLFMCLWEVEHYMRFRDFFSYGHHVDLVRDVSDAADRQTHTAYCLRVSNYSVFPLRFEAARLPSGITDNAVIFHDRLEKWSDESRSWTTVFDSTVGINAPQRANLTKTLLPGQSVLSTGCYDISIIPGLTKGDVVRLVSFAAFSKSEGENSMVFFSPPIVVEGYKVSARQITAIAG